MFEAKRFQTNRLKAAVGEGGGRVGIVLQGLGRTRSGKVGASLRSSLGESGESGLDRRKETRPIHVATTG